MKTKNAKFKHLNEIENNIGTQASSSSNYSNLKKNKKTFYQTNSTNYSIEQKNKNQLNNQKIKYQKNNQPISLRKNESTKICLKNPLINITTPNKRDIKIKESPIKIHSLVPTNINAFQHLITGNDFGIFENLNWTLGLRNPEIKNMKKNNSYKDKISLTQNFNVPSFYVEDLEKYKKKKVKNSEQKIMEYNPNYNKIKHLVLGKNNGNVNFSQYKFATLLRYYNIYDNKNNKEKEKKWKITPLPKIKSDNYMVKCLSPITHSGIQNVKKLEKIMPKNYEINHGEVIVGNDKIKTKILSINRSYTVSGFGDCLGDPKYDNKFRDKNIFANKVILSTEANPLSKFELGLRAYGSYKDINHFNKNNYKTKLK